jgi:hypothetical protein
MDDCTWYAAETVEEALQCFATDTGCKSVEELKEDNDLEPIELSPESMEFYGFLEDDENGNERKGERKTFREKLDEMISENHKFPCFFATTES